MPIVGRRRPRFRLSNLARPARERNRNRRRAWECRFAHNRRPRHLRHGFSL